MLCDICNKNPATVHLTEIVDEQMTELHLCEECAKAKSIEMEQHFGLADLLAGLNDFGKTQDDKEFAKIKCSNCGITYENFRKGGRLGCSECYNSFKKYLIPLLKRIHGSSQHVGKAPVGALGGNKQSSELQELKEALKKAIKDEEFEEAVRIRDRIRELEKKEEPKNADK